jgi:hypothetical protein
MMLIPLIALIAAVSVAAHADDAKINTPTRIAQLHGTWELQPDDAKAFKQRLQLGPGLAGEWQQSEATKSVGIAWFVEGNDLRLLYYYEPDAAFNYRVKTVMAAYKVSGDTLTLTLDGKQTTWKREKPATPAKP